MSKRLRILLGVILLTLMSVYFAIYVYSISLPRKGSSDGFSATWDGKGDPRITNVDDNSPSSGLLQLGDEIVAINGIKIMENPGVLLNSDNPPGTRLTLTVRRAGELRDATITTVPYATGVRFDPIHYSSILFLLTGWAVFLLRPEDKQACLLAVMLATLVGLVGNNAVNLPSWLAVVAGFGAATSLIFFPVFAHFFLIFPEPSPLLRRWQRLEFWLYLPFFLVILPVFGPGRLAPVLLSWVLKIRWNRFDFVAQLPIIAYLAAGLISLVINYQVADHIARRRLRVVMAGSVAGFLNLLILILGGPTGLQERLPAVWSWLEKAIYVTLPLVPLSFVYAIVRHKVIPVSLIIRRGVRYVLVSRGSVLIEAAVVILAVTVVLTYIFSRFRPSGIVIGTVSAAVAIFVWKLETRLHEKYLAPIIDRKFFRESYNSHQIIADLTDSLRSTTSLPQLCEQVATKIQTALQTENVVVLLRDEATGNYLSGYSCEFNSADGKAVVCQQPFRLHRDSLAVAKLFESGQPLEADSFDDDDLRKMKSALLLPLTTKQNMPGLISLGARLGDLPFSGEDKVLLMSVAAPTTFAIENSRLVERMIEEARRREEIEAESLQRAKELEEARQLQISMLPKTIPSLPNLEIAAFMKTATEVGGDYYDFHLSDDGTLTVAVGDATGHGLKAGTMVTAMKSLFHCLVLEPELVPMLSQSSRVLKAMNLRSLFMGLTMAKLRGRELKLSCAGMPPVFIYRQLTGLVEEVSIQAMPLGSVTTYVYRERVLQIETGDIVVMMSDGLPERFNGEGEMFDYDRVRESLIEAARKSPQEIVEHLATAGDVWANGLPQDDDVTLVVLKLKQVGEKE
ncbi:MAG: SpoIIE family protein phosphatase [Blastocatellia bacterium]